MDCNNHLRIEGSKEDMERFVTQAQAEEGDFLYSFIPSPIEYSHVTECAEDEWAKEVKTLLALKYGADNLLEWRLANWGTEQEEGDLSYDEQTHSFDFTTDSPPVVAIIRISRLYPGLKIFFEYQTTEEEADEVLGKWGKYIIQDGWIEHEEYENQNKGNLAKWIETLREEDKWFKELLQKESQKKVKQN